MLRGSGIDVSKYSVPTRVQYSMRAWSIAGQIAVNVILATNKNGGLHLLPPQAAALFFCSVRRRHTSASQEVALRDSLSSRTDFHSDSTPPELHSRPLPTAHRTNSGLGAQGLGIHHQARSGRAIVLFSYSKSVVASVINTRTRSYSLGLARAAAWL